MNSEEIKNASTLTLANRLNEIMKDKDTLHLKYNKLNEEHNAIVNELKRRYPNLKSDINVKEQYDRLKK